MAMSPRVQALRVVVAADCEILTDTADAAFRECLKRWTDIDRKTTGGDCSPENRTGYSDNRAFFLVVRRFDGWLKVRTAGGHSEWSPIGSDGVVVDLSRYSSIQVDAEAQTATLRGSVLSKEVAVRLAEAGLFTALGNGNAVGAIPYFLGGGASITTSTTGYGSDQIVSARLATAKGDLVDVTEQSHPDLLWAIRGAGQFFGLITQLVVRAHPLTALGNDKGVIWAGSFVFPLDRAKEVALVMKDLMDDSSHATAGLMMIMAPPPARKPSLVIAARYIGDPDNAKEVYKPLFDLQPLIAAGGEVPIQNTSDGREAIGAKGDFKRFGAVGLRRFDVKAFLEIIPLWKEMIAECADAINTAFNFQWDSRPPKKPDFESAMSLHGIRYWQNNLIWHTDPKNRSKVDEYNDKSILIMRGPDQTEWADFQNGTRIGPIELRYRGEAKLERLEHLKKEWDPTGVFTPQLL
ncbi:hypothetical protein MMC11_008536 [Xylographa trunciseda]|nr:hypothetical protein [Xylographa trunciseda]